MMSRFHGLMQKFEVNESLKCLKLMYARLRGLFNINDRIP